MSDQKPRRTLRKDDLIAWAIALAVFGGLAAAAFAGLVLVIGLLPVLVMAFPLTLTAVGAILLFALLRRRRGRR
ncbi:MAG: hypothetical protein GVY28_14350 [Alphaproteobacteria bacterium]|nr:hypothetical protein [Alphaproteobacteria bacterium]